MNSWYRLDIGSITQVAAKILEIQNAFRPIYLSTPAGSGMALFYRFNETTQTGEIFFTPQAATIANALGAGACEKPPIGNGRLQAIMGDDDLSTMFPGQYPA